MAKKKAPRNPAAIASIQKKQFRPGVSHEVIVKTTKEYLEIVAVHQEMEIVRWCLAVMSVSTAGFLITWFLWGFALMPNITKDMVKVRRGNFRCLWGGIGHYCYL